MRSGDGNARSGSRRSAGGSIRLLEDDDYDLTAHAVSDGFRPTASNGAGVDGADGADDANGAASISTPSSQVPRFQYPGLPRSPPPVGPSPLKTFDHRPSSMSKPPRHHDSLTLRNDGLVQSRPSEPCSSSSSSMQSDAPYHGSVHPSHPYQMYPQRTCSNATSSTERLTSEDAYSGRREPAHPYAMYAQDTASHRDPSRQPMLVGFNGMGDGYRRQLGPDGEEAGDLIGPLGHMEELPPYTRYPQEAFADKPTTEPIDHLTVSTVTDRNSTAAPGADRISPTDPIPGAGGIGLATRNPEFSSTEDLASLPLRASSIRSATSDGSQHDINGAARDFAEKPTQSKWQRRARKRLCGIVPYWVICLLLSGIVILGVVMGTVIGTMVTRHSGSPTPSDRSFAKPPVTNSVEFLASKPPDLPALATGCYALPPMEKYQVPKACIKDSSQTPAWSCDMPFRWYSMNVSNQDNQPDFSNYALKLAPFDARVSKFIWGSQPPEIPEFKTLRLVKDMEEANRGPAWYLEVDYNKTVMVREGQLKPASTGASKRNWEALSSPVPGFDKSRYLRKGFAAADGDKPWICTWPRIKLQVFIYPNQTFTPPRTSSASGSVATGSPSSTDGPSPPRKEPYPKLVKFVERRPDGLAASAPATCTQYQIVNNGQDKVPILDDNGRPVVIKISEVGQSSKDAVTRRQVNPGAGLLSSLQDRDVELTPCGCVSFSWSV